MNIQETLVTPEMAATWLKKDEEFEAQCASDPSRLNRPLLMSRVKQYEDIINLGHWVTTHQGIAFADTGRLLDGRHRLNAIRNTGKSVLCVVAYGLKESAFGGIDRGRPRSLSVAIGVTQKEAEMSRLLTLLGEYGRLNGKTTDFLVRKYHQAFAETIADVLHAFKANTTRTTAPVRTAAVVSLTRHFRKRDYVLQTYVDLCGFNVNGSKLALKFIAQIDKGITGAKDPADLFARAMFLLDPANEHCSTIRIDSVPACLDAARQTIVASMR